MRGEERKKAIGKKRVRGLESRADVETRPSIDCPTLVSTFSSTSLSPFEPQRRRPFPPDRFNFDHCSPPRPPFNPDYRSSVLESRDQPPTAYLDASTNERESPLSRTIAFLQLLRRYCEYDLFGNRCQSSVSLNKENISVNL